MKSQTDYNAPPSKFKQHSQFPALSETEIPPLDSYLDAPAYFNKENIADPLSMQSQPTSTASSPSQKNLGNYASNQILESNRNFGELVELKQSPKKIAFEQCMSPNLPHIYSQESTSPRGTCSPDVMEKIANDVNTATFKQLLQGIHPETPNSVPLNSQRSEDQESVRRSKYETFGQRGHGEAPATAQSQFKKKMSIETPRLMHCPSDTIHPYSTKSEVYQSQKENLSRNNDNRKKSQDEMQKELEELLQPPGRAKSPEEYIRESHQNYDEDRLTDFEESELDTERESTLRRESGYSSRLEQMKEKLRSQRNYNSSQINSKFNSVENVKMLQPQRSCSSLAQEKQRTPPQKDIQKPFKPSSLTASNQKNLNSILFKEEGRDCNFSPSTPGNAALCQLIEQLSCELENVKQRMRVMQRQFEQEKGEILKNFQNQSQKDHQSFQSIIIEQREIVRKEIEKEQEHYLEMALSDRLREARIEWQEDIRPGLTQAARKQASEELKGEREFIFQEAVESAKKDLEKDYQQSLSITLDNNRMVLKKQYEEELEKNISLIKEETQKTLNSKIKQLEGEIDQRAFKRAEQIKLECMQELRSEREKQLYRSLAEKLKTKIEKELYETLAKEIENQLRHTMVKNLETQIEEKHKKAYGVKKRQMEEKFKERLEEKELEIREQLQKQIDSLVREEIARKEKEFRTQAKVKIERMRKDLQEKFDREIKEELAMERESVMNEKAEIARLKSSQNIRAKKLEETIRELEEKLVAKDREYQKYKIEMQDLEVAHKNLKSTWMNERKDAPSPKLESFKKNKSISSGRHSRSGMKTLPLSKLNNTMGGGFNSARGSIGKHDRLKNKSLTSKVVPNTLKKNLMNKRKKCNAFSISGSNSVNVSRNSHPAKGECYQFERRCSLSPSVPSCVTSIPHNPGYEESEDNFSERGADFLGTDPASGYGINIVYARDDGNFMENGNDYEDVQQHHSYNLPRQVDNYVYGSNSRQSTCPIYSDSALMTQSGKNQEEDEQFREEEMQPELEINEAKQDYSLLAWSGSQKIKNMIQEKCQLNMAQRIQELNLGNALENSDQSEENNTFGFELHKNEEIEKPQFEARRASSSMIINLRTDSTPQKEVTPNFMNTKLSGKKKHNFKLHSQKEQKEEISLPLKSSARMQIRFEPGKEDLYESYITRFRQKEKVFEKSYQADAKRIVEGIEAQFLEAGTSEHGLLGYLCDLWQSLGISYERRVNFLHDLEQKAQFARKSSDKLKAVYSILNQETGTLATKRKEMIAVLSFIRNKEKLAQFVKKNPKNKIKRSEFMNARLSLYHAAQEYRKKNGEHVMWRGQILSDVRRKVKQTLKYEKWNEDNELKGEIKQEILEKKKKI